MNEKKKINIFRKDFVMRFLRLSGSRYVICGGITTLVNYVIYAAFLAMYMTGLSGIPLLHLADSKVYLLANALAWVGAVIAAYIMNRKWVFQSENRVVKEFLSFVAMRFLTLLAESVLLWLLVDCMKVHPMGSKILVSVVTVAANYVLCKFKIFVTKKEEYCNV